MFIKLWAWTSSESLVQEEAILAYQFKHNASWTVIMICVYGVGAAAAADVGGTDLNVTLPAVSSPNAKFAIGGGAFDAFDSAIIQGAITVPLTFSTGLQVDGLAGIADDGGIFGGGAHLFWRDPSVGLFGVYGSVTDVDVGTNDYTHFTAGIEAAAYLGQFSLETTVGVEGGDNVEDGFFTISNLAYYPTDDLRLFAGVRYIQEDFIGAVGAEYQFSSAGADQAFSVFGEARVGDDNMEVWGGLRVYFGQPNSLIGRHREDDPANPSLDFLFDATLDQAPVTVETSTTPSCEATCD